MLSLLLRFSPCYCPRCGSSHIDPSRATRLERMLRILKAFRCEECWKRFYVLQL